MSTTRLLGRASSLALVIGLFATAAHAQEATGTPREVVVTGQRVVTAPPAPPIDTPYTMTTITSDDVRNLSLGPSVNLQTLLSNQPSIYAYANGPLGTGTNIFYRSFNSGQFAETYDGVALNDVFNGGVTGEADTVNNVLLLPVNVDSVELYHGINNPAVNSYNSLGGTINYLPRLPSQTPGATVLGSYGSFDTWTAHGEINTGDIMGAKQLFSFDYAKSDGWIPNTPARNINAYYSGAYDAPNGDHVGLVLVFNDNRANTPMQMPVPLLQANGGYWQWPKSVAYEQDNDRRYMAILDFNAPLNRDVTFDSKVFGGYNGYVRTSYANPAYDESATQPYELYSQSTGFPYWAPGEGYPVPLTYVPANVFGSTHLGTDYHYYGYAAWGVGYQPTLTVALPHNTLTFGGNLTYGELRSREYWYGSYNMPLTDGYNDAWDEHDSRLMASGYVQDEIKLLDDALTITPGVKYMFAHTTDNDAIGFYYPYGGSVGDDEHFISPTVGVNYKVANDLSLNFAFGENVKFPDIAAYYDNIPGNAAPTGAPPYTPPAITLKPEHVNDYEGGIKYQHGALSAELSVYREDFSDIFIDAFDPVSYLTVVTNGGDARYQGVELRLNDEFNIGQYGLLKPFLNFSYNQAKFTSSFTADSVGGTLSEAGAPVTAGERMGDVPDILGSAGVVWTMEGWRFQATGRYIGNQILLNYNTGVPDANGAHIGGYMIADLGLSKTFELKDPGMPVKSVMIGVNVDNLFDKYYYNYADTSTSENYFRTDTIFASPGAPRAIVGKIQVSF